MPKKGVQYQKMMMVPYQLGEEMLKSQFSDSPRLKALISSAKKEQQILNNPNMSAAEKVELTNSLAPEIRKRFKNYRMQQVVGIDGDLEDEPDDLMTTGEQKVLQKIANMFKAKTPDSVKREIKQEPNNPTIDANLPPKEYIEQAYETHVIKKKNKRPIPGSLNWYPSPLKATKRRKLQNNTKGKLLRVLKKASGWEDWEPQGKKVKKKLSYSTVKKRSRPGEQVMYETE